MTEDEESLGALLWILVGVVVVAGALAWILILPTYEARSWPETTCTIERSWLEEIKDDEGYVSYNLRVVYNYEVDGHPYVSDRYTFFDVSSEAEKRTELKRLAAGIRVPCYFDPTDPGAAVLKREYVVSGWLLLLVLLPFTIITFVVVVYRRQGRHERMESRLREQWQRVGLADGQVRLEPRRRGRKRLILSTLAGLVLTSLVILLAIGFPYVNQSLFVAILVLLGAGALLADCWFVYSLAQARTPSVRVVSVSPSVRLGESVNLGWQLRGMRRSVREIRMWLIGSEETDNAQRAFFRRELTAIRKPKKNPSEKVTITVPADTMHSFDGGHSRIVWLVRITADVARWPDIEEEFELEVLPQRSKS